MEWMYFTLFAQLLLLLVTGAHSRPSSDDPTSQTTSPVIIAKTSAVPIVPTVSTVLANDTVIANQFIDHLNLTHVGAQQPPSAAATAATAVTNRRYVSAGDVASRKAELTATSTLLTFGGSLTGQRRRLQRRLLLPILTNNPNDSETETDALQYVGQPSSIIVEHTFADYERSDNKIVNDFLAAGISDLSKNFTKTVIQMPPSEADVEFVAAKTTAKNLLGK